jgi:uncharacterized LabA/DUF88 family protein
MERIVIHDDYANTKRAFDERGVRRDNKDLLGYLSEGRFLVEAHTYVPIDPRNPHARDREIEELWRAGWLVHPKIGSPAGDTYKCDFDVEITLDLMRTAEIVKPDIIVLLSGDKDFVPVILELRQRGIRVEVAAFPELNAAREVMLKASGFIDLGAYLEERQDQATEAAKELGAKEWPDEDSESEVVDLDIEAADQLPAPYLEQQQAP